MTYDAVLFDNDGVLVGRTPYDVLQGAAWDAFDALGVDDPDPDHVESIVVGVSPDDVHSVAETYDVDPHHLWETRERTAASAQQDAVFAGKKSPYSDVGTLRDIDVPMGVVSSNQQETVDFLMKHYGLDNHFDAAYGREPTVESLDLKKPNAHYLERALADLSGVDSGSTNARASPDGGVSALFVGDNESDVEAAHNAGMDSAFIRRPHRRSFDLSVTPTHDVADLHEVRALCT